MNRVLIRWTTALALALLLGVTPGIAGVSQAAPSRLELYADPGARHDTYVYVGTDDLTGQETLIAAVLVGSTWKDAPIKHWADDYWSRRVPVGSVVPAPGKYTVRVSLLDGADVLESVTTTVTVKKYGTQGLGLSIADHTLAGKKLYAHVTGGGFGQKIALQRRVKKNGKKTWVTVRTATMPLRGDGSSATVKLAMPRTTGYTTWRAVGSAGTWVTSGGATAAREVHRTDDKRYGAYLKRARSYLKAYCPRTPISINTREVTKRNVIGVAEAEYGRTGGTSYLSTRIALRSGLNKRLLRHVALHECAHVVQYRKIVKKGGAGYQQYAKAVGKIYKVPKHVAVEQQADCMAALIVKSTRDNYYTKNCRGKRTTSARALWRALGKKYQASYIEW